MAKRKTPKFFKVDYIPEARGRKAVRDFAFIVNQYAQMQDIKLGDLKLEYGSRGEVLLRLYTSEDDGDMESVDGVLLPKEEKRPPEPDEE
jgi:hypothetical protein